jgi:uncharacterized membrane protein
MKSFTSIILVVVALIFTAIPVLAQDTPVVQAVLFFNPDCEICHQVMTNDLPPLQAKYGAQLAILPIDTSQPDGINLYRNMSSYFQLTEDRLGTPAIVIGESVLVGGDEIPAMLPGLIETGLSSGGISWPEIPGLSAYMTSSNRASTYPAPLVYPKPAVSDTGVAQPAGKSTWERFSSKFGQDPVANSLAVIVLAGMVVTVIFVIIILVRSILSENPAQATIRFSRWLIPLLVIIGIGVAGYLTFVEVGNKQAICGPIGHCNEVQNSSYAKLFGILHVGLFGLMGYAALLVAWVVHEYGPKALRMLSAIALWGMSLFGVAFSIYLTFLEPFVIGATCMWCLSSALLMTAMLWITTPILQDALTSDDIPGEELPEFNIGNS